MSPAFLVDTTKPFEQTCADLKAALATHDFGLLANHDLAATLRSKTIAFPENCRVFEVCNNSHPVENPFWPLGVALCLKEARIDVNSPADRFAHAERLQRPALHPPSSPPAMGEPAVNSS